MPSRLTSLSLPTEVPSTLSMDTHVTAFDTALREKISPNIYNMFEK